MDQYFCGLKHRRAKSLKCTGIRHAQHITEIVESKDLRIWQVGFNISKLSVGKSKTMVSLSRIPVSPYDRAVIIDLYRHRIQRARHVDRREIAVFPHKALDVVNGVPFRGAGTYLECSHNHAGIIDANGPRSPLRAGERDNRELSLMQQEPVRNAVAGKYPNDIAQIIDAGGTHKRVRETRKLDLTECA
jgi:hypothetical protein